MQVEKTILIDVESLLEKLSDTDKWEAFQMLYDSLNANYNKLDWEDFCEENEIKIIKENK